MAQLPTDNGVMAHTEHIRKKRNTAIFAIFLFHVL